MAGVLHDEARPPGTAATQEEVRKAGRCDPAARKSTATMKVLISTGCHQSVVSVGSHAAVACCLHRQTQFDSICNRFDLPVRMIAHDLLMCRKGKKV